MSTSPSACERASECDLRGRAERVREREREREREGGGGYQRTISARLQRSVAPEWVPPTTDKSGRGLRSDVFHGY